MSWADVLSAAKALNNKGAKSEAKALLRGALGRADAPVECVTLLRKLEDGDAPPTSETTFVLDLPLVKQWIATGRFVEALAILNGVELGPEGDDLATRLDELLASPARASEIQDRLHSQILVGEGAKVLDAFIADPTLRSSDWGDRTYEFLRWALSNTADAATHPSKLAMMLQEACAASDIDFAADWVLRALERKGYPAELPIASAALARLIGALRNQELAEDSPLRAAIEQCDWTRAQALLQQGMEADELSEIEADVYSLVRGMLGDPMTSDGFEAAMPTVQHQATTRVARFEESEKLRKAIPGESTRPLYERQQPHREDDE